MGGLGICASAGSPAGVRKTREKIIVEKSELLKLLKTMYIKTGSLYPTGGTVPIAVSLHILNCQ